MKNENKHAYLLMLHHRKDLVDLLLEQLDDPRNDIYFHIDKRCTEFSFEDFDLKYANKYNVDPIEVNWGGYSQIKCEFLLMKAAKKNGPYAYYHFMQGDSYPLKSQDKLHEFYKENNGTLFISIDNKYGRERVEHIYLFNERYGLPGRGNRFLVDVSNKFINLQTKFHYDRFSKYNLEFKKGFCLWSIPDDFLTYLIDNEKKIHKIFKYSFCCDEVFIQTMAYNSKFRDRINFINDKYSSSKWFATWSIGKHRPNHDFCFEDFPRIINSNNNFARKFSNKEGKDLINTIKKHIENS